MDDFTSIDDFISRDNFDPTDVMDEEEQRLYIEQMDIEQESINEANRLGGFAELTLDKWLKQDELGVLHMLMSGELYERLHKIDELAETELPRMREEVRQALPKPTKAENEYIHATAATVISTQRFLDKYTEMPAWEESTK